MPFECQQCGECCSHLGLVHTIHDDLGDHRFVVRNTYTGEKTIVTVDPDKVGLFSDRNIFEERPEACPFFRYDKDSAKGYCTVHFTRPDICRDYGCWRILILTPDGRRAGRIMGERHLASDDPVLTGLFEDKVNDVIEPDTTTWDRMVLRVLAAAGYTVRT